MKLAKKILACVIALALTACLGVVAFAADAPSASVATKFNEATRELTVTLYANGAKETASLFLDYSKEDATFVSATAFQGSYTAVAGETNDSDKLLSGSAMSMTEFGADTIEIGTYVLKVKEGVKSLTLTVAGDSEIDGSKVEGSFVASTEVATTEPTSATKGDDTKTTKPAGGETTTKKPSTIKKTGDASIAVIAGVSALAAVAFVVTKKK